MVCQLKRTKANGENNIKTKFYFAALEGNLTVYSELKINLLP